MVIINKILILLLVSFIKTYRFFSPFFYKGVCRFNPTCTDYTIKSILKNGPIIGLYKGATRLLKCHPFSKYSFYSDLSQKVNKLK